ncbi:MAG: hypothetical protein NC311_13720 [Muribaculaceae bacterium]|nr:hypothetical protein [Muribaculaceae bacterium]
MDANVEKIVNAVATEYGISTDVIMSRSREQRVADARMMAMYLVFRKSDYTYSKIGEMFCRTHPTVCYNVSRAEDLIGFDRATKRHYQRLKELL